MLERECLQDVSKVVCVLKGLHTNARFLPKLHHLAQGDTGGREAGIVTNIA